MNPTLGQLLVRIGADVSELRRAFSIIKTETQGLQQSLKSAGESLTRNVTLPLLGLGTASVLAAGNLQQARLGLESVAGSTAEAERQLIRLRELARNPGLGFRQAIDASVKLQTLGFSAEQAEAAIRELGNAVALTGGTREDFGEISRQFAQIRSLGRLTAENLNVIIERSPAVAAAMQAAFGSASAEAIRESGISIDDFFSRLQAGLETLPRAQASILDTFGNIKDDITTAIAPLGEAIAEVLIPVLQQVVAFIQRVSDAFKDLEPGQKRFVVFTLGAVAALGPLLVALSGVVAILPALTTGIYAVALAFGPIGPLLVIVATAFLLVYRRSEEVRAATGRLIDAVRTNARAFVSLGEAIGSVIPPLEDATGRSTAFGNVLRGLPAAAITVALRALGDAVRLVTAYVQGVIGVFTALTNLEDPIAGFFAGVIRGLRGVAGAANDAAGALNKTRGLFVGKKAEEGGDTPFGSLSTGAAEATSNVRTLQDVMTDLRRTLDLIGPRVSLGLITPFEAARERADALRRALEEALTMPGFTTSQADALAADLASADKEARRFAEGMSTATREVLAFKAAVQEAQQQEIALAIRTDEAAAALARARAAVVQVSQDVRTFADSLREGLVDGLINLVNGLAGAFGNLAGNLAEFRGLGETFQSFVSDVRRALGNMVASVVAAIAKLLLLRALLAGLNLLGLGGVGGLITGALGFTPGGGGAGALAGGGTLRLELGGATMTPQGLLVPIQGGVLRTLREEVKIEAGGFGFSRGL